MSNGTETYLPPRLVFVHVMKTAGTSLTYWIARHYRQDDILTTATTWGQFARLPQKAWEHKKFVRGHFGNYARKFFKPSDGYRYITVLRDPVERILSNFWHFKRVDDNPYHRFMKENEFTLYHFMTDPRTDGFTRNFHVANFGFDLQQDFDVTTMDSNLVTGKAIDRFASERAKEFLGGVDVIGFQEDMASAVKAVSSRFGFYPDPNFAKTRSYRDGSEGIPADMLDRLRDINQLDRELYDWAVAHENERQSSRKAISTPPAMLPNPIDAVGQKLLHWRAMQPYFGTGWSDIQHQTGGWQNGRTPLPPHRWSEGRSPSTIAVRVEPKSRYQLLVEVARFVSRKQSAGFTLSVNGNPVPLIAKTEVDGCDSEGGLFSAQFGPLASPDCAIGFHVSPMQSFREVNPKDPNAAPRGLALSAIILVKLPD
jgi:Sulfotransferase family